MIKSHEISVKHPWTSLISRSFLQRNGDIFAFDHSVDANFMHGVYPVKANKRSREGCFMVTLTSVFFCAVKKCVLLCFVCWWNEWLSVVVEGAIKGAMNGGVPVYSKEIFSKWAAVWSYLEFPNHLIVEVCLFLVYSSRFIVDVCMKEQTLPSREPSWA